MGALERETESTALYQLPVTHPCMGRGKRKPIGFKSDLKNTLKVFLMFGLVVFLSRTVDSGIHGLHGRHLVGHSVVGVTEKKSNEIKGTRRPSSVISK